MKLIKQTPRNVLKSFLKNPPEQHEIDLFKKNLIILLDKIDVIEKRQTDESEEHIKIELIHFLIETYYRDTNAINTKGKKDLVIHLDKTTNSDVGVIIEAKRPTNVAEMITADHLNKKAFYEIILYYLNERNHAENNQIKQLVITNINEWYIIDANYFDKHIYRNTQIKKLYDTKINDKKDNPFFYEEIAKIVSKIDIEMPCVYFNIKDYNIFLRNNSIEDDKELIPLFKIFSPQYLLKTATPNDSNSLNDKFYKELLHLIGLKESENKGKKLIQRKLVGEINSGSLIESTINQLNTYDKISRLNNPHHFGSTNDERLFGVALELCITWVNRILFLKLLEAQLISYNKTDIESYSFLNLKKIKDYDDLDRLFFEVLAIKTNERNDAVKQLFGNVPYLNSSLFEPTELEQTTVFISNRSNNDTIPIISDTVLKNDSGKKESGNLKTLDYLLLFLDAYDFSSEGKEEIKKDNKPLISASVLGLIFEKINGYKDGSFFTPSFITMYMCSESIRTAVVQKFNEIKGWNCKEIKDVEEKLNIDDRKEANEIVNSIKICDPAVGSGHFLVSALNEIIAIKSDLRILQDVKGVRIKEYTLKVFNDEINIRDEDGKFFRYNPKNTESQRIQEAIFNEKQTIIENCLFGVDINHNSVKICRLRLWIELLKNTYYKPDGTLETLPNIDINIKTGNSIISRFDLDVDLKQALIKSNQTIASYRQAIHSYRNAKSKDEKRKMEQLIKDVKGNFKTYVSQSSKDQINLNKLKEEYDLKHTSLKLFNDSETKVDKKKAIINRLELQKKIDELQNKINIIKSNKIYENAFEWRFEFPEVLDDNGNYLGFDAVIGNPPYIGEKGNKEVFRMIRQGNFAKFYQRKMDIFYFFFHLGLQLLKEKGNLSFITTNYYLTSDGGEKLRTDFKENATVRGLINLNQLRVFESAQGQHNLITFLTKGVNTTFLSHNLVTNEKGSCNQELFDKVILAQNENSIIYTPPQSELYETINNYIRPQGLGNKENSTKENTIFNKIIEQGTPLIQICDISQGILSGADRISNKHIESGLTEKENNNHGIYVLTNDEVKNKNLSKQELELIRPWFKNSDIHKYYTSDESKYKVIYATRNIEINDYPTIKKHFEKFKAVINNRSQERGEIQAAVKLGKWWVIFAARNKSVFEGEKIVCPQRTKTNVFGYNNDVWYSSADVYYITNSKSDVNLKYILALLNSKLYYFWLYNKGKRKGENLELYYTPLTEIPIKIIENKNQKPFIDLVDKIIIQKQKGEDTKTNETLIDKMVYNLYGLTAPEIELVGKSLK